VRQLCCQQVLLLAASVCLSVTTQSRKLQIRNWCNLVGMCPTVNARSGWKLVTFDLDLWPWELFSYFIHRLVVSNALTQQVHFSVKVRFQNIKVTFEFQGHVVDIKVKTAASSYVLPWTKFNLQHDSFGGIRSLKPEQKNLHQCVARVSHVSFLNICHRHKKISQEWTSNKHYRTLTSMFLILSLSSPLSLSLSSLLSSPFDVMRHRS